MEKRNKEQVSYNTISHFLSSNCLGMTTQRREGRGLMLEPIHRIPETVPATNTHKRYKCVV